MLVRLLGPVEIVGAEGSIAVGGPKERALLAFLALRVNETVSEATLIDALWAEDPPRTAVRTLQAYLSRLRRGLQEVAEGAEASLEKGPGGWALRAPQVDIDLCYVEMLSTTAQEALTGGDYLDAALSLAHALEVWRGEPMAEFGGLPWADAERVRLGELRSMLIETRLEAELACGRATKLLGELEARCRAEPLRERLWALRMLALYRAGRQADALRAFQELRSVLRDEIGIDPSPALVQLEQQILAQDPDLDDGPLPSRSRSEATPPGPVHQTSPQAMPSGLTRLRATSFVGREAELAALAEAWERTKAGFVEIVLLSGEPGIGKTSLAVEQAALATGGAVVLFGRCDEESLVPFQPFVEAIGDHAAATEPDALRSQLGDLACDLAPWCRPSVECCRRSPTVARPALRTSATGSSRRCRRRSPRSGRTARAASARRPPLGGPAHPAAPPAPDPPTRRPPAARGRHVPRHRSRADPSDGRDAGRAPPGQPRPPHPSARADAPRGDRARQRRRRSRTCR